MWGFKFHQPKDLQASRKPPTAQTVGGLLSLLCLLGEDGSPGISINSIGHWGLSCLEWSLFKPSAKFEVVVTRARPPGMVLRFLLALGVDLEAGIKSPQSDCGEFQPCRLLWGQAPCSSLLGTGKGTGRPSSRSNRCSNPSNFYNLPAHSCFPWRHRKWKFLIIL